MPTKIVFEPRGSITGDLTSAIQEFIVSNGVTCTKGYAVTLWNGYLENVAANQPLLGVAAETVKGTTASVKCGVYCDPNILYYNDADGNNANADVGQAYQVTASRRIDQSTGLDAEGANLTKYQFILVKTDPDGDADRSKGLFKPFNSQLSHQ